jgi:hypothetical protein
MDVKGNRGLFIAGGICAIAWPILSELVFFALYPVLASGGLAPEPGIAGVMTRYAQAGQRPALLALEWGKVAVQLLQWPFWLAVYRLLSGWGQRNLTLIGVGLGLVAMVLNVISHTFTPTLSHDLGQAYVDAESPPEGAAISAVLMGLLGWRAGLNRTASLLYQACVGLVGLALIQSQAPGRTGWRFWGWLGLIAALLALPAKLPLGIRVPTNLIWTGLAYLVWPIGMGLRLLGAGRDGHSNPGPRPSG